MSRRRFLLATRSVGKLRELREIFSGFDLEVVDLSTLGIAETSAEDDLERYDNFEDNALAKARYFFELSGGLPTFGDDSGMCVDALGGEPGVYSKRWSGREDLDREALDDANNAKLVTRMQAALREGPDGYTDRALYVSVAAFKDAAGEMIRRGEIEGRIIVSPRGTGGFGYDPYFEVPELGGTYAEFSVENKAASSHRARAFRALLAALRAEARV